MFVKITIELAGQVWEVEADVDDAPPRSSTDAMVAAQHALEDAACSDLASLMNVPVEDPRSGALVPSSRLFKRAVRRR